MTEQVVMESTVGTVRVSFDAGGRVTARANGATIEDAPLRRRELAALLRRLGLPADEAAALALEAWRWRP